MIVFHLFEKYSIIFVNSIRFVWEFNQLKINNSQLLYCRCRLDRDATRGVSDVGAFPSSPVTGMDSIYGAYINSM